MDKLDYEKIVSLVTAEVMKAITDNKVDSENMNYSDIRPLALVIGDTEKLPNFAKETYQFKSINDYDGDISEYERIFISELNYTQLSDIALGRNDGKVQCAVISGILQGKKISIMESAFTFRKYKQSSNRAFYNMLEGYTHTLTSFGVELIKEQWYGKNISRSSIIDNTFEKVITEKDAKLLIKKDGDIISLRKGTVITPSAKDIFNHSDKKVEFVD